MSFAIAHRGLSAERPENTLAAFEAAREAGFAGLEMDLRLTRDHEVVVIHDEGLERTTGQSGRVADMSYDELRTYETGAGPIPRLDDVLSRLADWDALWNLEVKAPRALTPMLEVLDHHRLDGRALISSMNPDVLRKAHQKRPDHPRGLIVLGPPDEEDYEEARRAEASWLMLDVDFLDEATAQDVQEAGYRLGAWTVNDPSLALEATKAGAECIITDTRSVLEAVGQSAGSWT